MRVLGGRLTIEPEDQPADRPEDRPEDQPEDSAEVGRLRRRLDRERRARLEAESIAERATTELFEMVLALRRSKAVIDETPDLVAIADLDGRVSYLNRAFEEMLGLAAEDTVDGGDAEVNLWHLFDEHSQTVLFGDVLPVLERKGLWHGEMSILRPNSTVIPVSQVLIAHRQDDGRLESVSSISRDITERLEMAARLTQQALHDPLTGLPNRLLITDRLEQALGRSIRGGGLVGVVYLDLDRFKLINDGLGHGAGDELLRAVARRIERSVRSSDTVGRLGGDEFIVVYDGLQEESEIVTLVRRIEAALGQPCPLGDEEVFIGASVGISIGDGTEGSEELIRRADEAMYEAKRAGRGRYEVFREGLRAQAVQRLQTENDLHRAVEAGELCLHYQPVIELATRRIVGVEALIRWDHPTRGLLAPDSFISVAEDNGLIGPIGRWVITEACRQEAIWRAAHPGLIDFHIAVNLSAHQLNHPGLSTLVADALGATGAAPQSIAFELTESILMDAEGPTLVELRKIKDLGCEIGTDDFGIGYSSLSYLKRFPVDFFKIDRSFVAGLGEARVDEAIVDALLCLGRGLNLRVIAEGVETTQQLGRLDALGCLFAQGYLFARPQPPEDLGDLTRAL